MKIGGRPARFLVSLGYQLFRLWAWTLRFELDDRGGLVGAPRKPFIGAVWHNRLFLFPYVIRRFLPEVRGSALISASRDGAIMADFVSRFGFGAVRGSSSRRGAAAMLQLADVLAAGNETAIVPDGPRGPAYVVGPGIVFLAQKSGVDIVPINLEFERCWRMKSWDRFILPKPFSKVRVIFGGRYSVPPTATDEEFEAERKRLEATLMSLVEMR